MSSDFLFVRPSLFHGIARLGDLWGFYDSYNVSPTPADADRLAIKADWLAVGEDLQSAMETVNGEIPDAEAA